MKFFGLFKVSKRKKKKDNIFLISEDVKNIDHLLIKRHKTVEEIEHIDRKIVLIQKSTQTTIPQLRPLHDTLRQKYRWYYNWHLQPYAKSAHILFLLFYIISAGFTLNYLIKPVTKIMAQVPTYAFPRWEWSNPKPTGNDLNKVTTCPDGTVWAVGKMGTILKSTDSVTWKQEYTGVEDTLNDIYCQASNNIIAVGNNRIMQFTGQSWTNRLSGTVGVFKAITYSSDQNIYAAVGDGVIYYSTNGISWTQVTDYGGQSPPLSSAVIYAKNMFVAVGNGVPYYSNNGREWTKSPDLGSNLRFTAINYGNNKFVAVGANYDTVGPGGGPLPTPDIYCSTDGATWTKATFEGGALAIYQGFNAITYANDKFIAVGSRDTYSLSNSANEWVKINSVKGLASTYANNRFVIVGDSNNSYYSENGIDWGAVVGYGGISLAYANSRFISVGSGGQIYTSANNGLTWQGAGSSIDGNNSFADITYGANNFVAVGVSGTIAYSTDGANWTKSIFNAVEPNENSEFKTVTFGYDGDGNGRFVAAGSNAFGSPAIIYYSNDGVTWTASTYNIAPPGSSGFLTTTYGYDSNGNGRFIAAGSGYDNDPAIIYYSTDGTAWTKGNYNIVPKNGSSFYSLASASGKFIATGYESLSDPAIIYHSDDGATWTKGTYDTVLPSTIPENGSFFKEVIYSGDKFVAVGGNYGVGSHTTIYYSMDGTVWTKAINNGYNPALNPTDIAYGSGKFVVIGAGGSGLAYSDDGISWVDVTSLDGQVLTGLDDIVYGNGKFTAVGPNGSIYQSTNGTAWTKINSISSNQLTEAFSSPIDNSILVLGSVGTILHYSSPANATATKLLVSLPGQSFVDGHPISGVPTSVRAGDNVKIYAYAVDGSNKLDRGIAYQVRISSTDPRASNTATFNLDNDNNVLACNSTETARTENPCGAGYANYVFHTSGDYTVYAQDTGGSGLTQGVSTMTIHVTAGPVQSLVFGSLPSSLPAGTVSGAITIQAKDLYGNNTTVTADTTINLKTTSTAGRFSTDGVTWFVGEINLTIPAGSGSVTYYYLDLATSSPTITATSAGLTISSSTINITVGELSLSTLTLSQNSIRAGESLTAQVNLKNSQGVILSGKTARLYSSREGDNTGGDQVTDGNGNANFNVSATRVGSFDLIIYDVSDNVYATVSQTVQVSPGDLASASLTSNHSSVTAGDSINLNTTLKDRFGNTLNASNSLIGFSSSDSQAEFEQKNHSFSDNGSYSQNVILKTAGTQTIEATKNGSVLGSTTVNVNPTSVSADVSQISSDKDRIDPSTGVASITVRLLDAFGNPIAGKNISLTSSRNEDKITPSVVVTGDDGKANFSFSSDVQGDSVIVAQDMTDSIVLTKQLKIRIAPANILDKIKESPVAKALTNILAPVSKAIALLGLIPLLLQILQAIPSAVPLASSVFPVLFTTASVRRRKKPWGSVFDSITGHAVDLAVVRLYEKETDKLISTQVTDFDGRFHFLAGTGTYYIKVEKKGYQFPANISKFKASQLSSRFGKDSDIYLGVPFSIQSKNAQINLNIPLEPVYEKLTNNIKFRKRFKESVDWFLIIVSYIAVPLMLIGAVIAAFSTVVKPTDINFITDGAYLVLLSGFLVTGRIRKNRMGQVFDSKTRESIVGAMVTVFDSEYNAIRQTQTTDKNGNFAILAQKGEYYIVVEKEGYKFPSTELTSTKKQPIYTGGTINKSKPGFIGIDVPLDKK